MTDIKVAFWNLENLFDTTASEIATDLEFTPENGWTEAVFNKKVENLASVINMMHDGQGPDLLGVCEIENKGVAQTLMKQVGRPDYKLAHVESPDIRGIDVSLIYSSKIFQLAAEPVGHLVYQRYPTRDIFEVRLTVIENGAELTVFVNHWPSRKQGQYQSEPHRMTVADYCGRLVEEVLKFSRSDFLDLPNAESSLQKLIARWNRNVLVMGDFNDEPFNRSILEYLLASRDYDHVEEQVKASRGRKIPTPKAYLQLDAYLFNCMWPLLGQPDVGTLYYSGATNSMNLLDHFTVSRGLLCGEAKLRIDLASVRIFTPAVMTSPKKRPVPFDRKTKKGYSDHFPIEAVIKTV
jgi:endonuclease/exonuclease/phosphatase family metal-dependent hydrolase